MRRKNYIRNRIQDAFYYRKQQEMARYYGTSLVPSKSAWAKLLDLSRVSFYTRPYDRLEPYDGKLSRTVLRGGAGSNASLLPDIRSEKDILKLVNTIIVNTKGEGQQSGEDFWVKAEKLYYTALIAYIWYEAPEEEQNFAMLIDMIDASEAREDDENFKNAVDLLFEELEADKPNHFAVRQYKKYKLAAGDICSKWLLNHDFVMVSEAIT